MASTSMSSFSYTGFDPKMSVKKFEAHKAFYEPSTDQKMYKLMRRAVRPTMPFFLFARHSDTKFYEDYWYLYPEKPKNCDYNVLINKMKRDSQNSSRISDSALPKLEKSKKEKKQKKIIHVDEYIDNYTDYHKTQNYKSTKFFT